MWVHGVGMSVSAPLKPTTHDIAERAHLLKVVFLALGACVPAMLDPDLMILRGLLVKAGAQPHEENFPMEVGGHERIRPGIDKVLTFSMREVLTAASTALPFDVVRDDVFAIGMLHGGIRLGDMINRGGFLNDTSVPLLQFAKHFRNACAHGDRWHFQGPISIRRPAAGSPITDDLHGKRATMEAVSPRLYVDFLDDIANDFVPGRVPPPAIGQ